MKLIYQDLLSRPFVSIAHSTYGLALNGHSNDLEVAFNAIAAVADPGEIVGAPGVNDALSATAGHDLFIFKPGFGHDTVTGFQFEAGRDTLAAEFFLRCFSDKHLSFESSHLRC